MNLQPTPTCALASKHNIAFENDKYNVYSYLTQKADTRISMSAKASSLACGSLHGGRGQESHNLFPVLAHENSEVRSGHVADVEPQQVPHLSLNVTGFGQVPELVFSKATHRTLRGIGQVLNRDIYARKRARNHAHTSSTTSGRSLKTHLQGVSAALPPRHFVSRRSDSLAAFSSPDWSDLSCNQSPLGRGFLYGPRSNGVETLKYGPSAVTLLHHYYVCQDDTEKYVARHCSRATSDVVLAAYLWKSSHSIKDDRACSFPQTIIHRLNLGWLLNGSMHHTRLKRTAYHPGSPALGFPHTAHVLPGPNSPLEFPVGVTKALISFKASEQNVVFIDSLRARLANRMSRSLVVEELVTVCRVMYDTHELTFTPEDKQVILSISGKCVDVGDYPVLAYIPDLREGSSYQLEFCFAD